MNKKTVCWSLFYLLSSLVVIATVTSCSLSEIWTEGRERETSIRDERYTIDPSTLLATIKEGKSNSFTLLRATPPVHPSRSNTPIQWKQADYLFISKAFHQFVWHEPFPEGELIDIRYSLDCKEVGYGLQSAKYKLVHITKSKEDETRIDRTIIIDPAYSQVFAWEYSYNPNYSRYKFIDISNCKKRRKPHRKTE